MRVDPASFVCPFPSAISPHVALLERHCLAWARRFRMVERGSAAEARLARARFGTAVARTYPEAPLAALLTIAEWITWLFLYDDSCDQAGGTSSIDALARLHARLIAVLEGDAVRAGEPAAVHALAAIREGLVAQGSDECVFRFTRGIEAYLQAVRAEEVARACGRIPDLAGYLRLRRSTGCVYPCLELIDLAAGIDLPPEVRDHERVQELADLTADVICWSNDILSYAKEVLVHGDVHNLVFVLQHEHAATPAAALDRALKMHNDAVQAFAVCAAELPSFGADLDAALARYVDGLRAWMRGNLDWSFETPRYRDALAEASALAA